MTPEIAFFETKDRLIIEIQQRLKGIIIFGLVLIGLIFLCSSAFFLFLLLVDIDEMTIFPFILLSSATLVAFLASISFLNKTYNKETITITKDTISINEKKLLTRKGKDYSKGINDKIEYVGSEHFTNHNLSTKSFDYLGLGTQEKQVQFIIESGRLMYTNKETTIRFGKDVYEEDAEEIINRIKNFA